MTKPFPEISANDDAWTVAQAELDDEPILIRFRPDLAQFDGKSEFGLKLVIRWDAPSDESESDSESDEQTEFNLPSEEMDALEDALVDAMEPDRIGILTYVFTFVDAREWHIYFTDIAEMQTALDAAVDNKPPMPLEIQAFDDAQWEDYTELIESVH